MPNVAPHHEFDAIGQMSCNPAVGGTAKDISSARSTRSVVSGAQHDRSAIQFKTLNASRGPAVRARAPSAIAPAIGAP